MIVVGARLITKPAYMSRKNLGAKMIYIDKVNSADRPGTTPDQLAGELVAQGAKLVIFNSDDMKDASTEFAKANPDVKVIMASGDQVWPDGKDYEAIDNLTNIMGRMEYGKMIAGCSAALTTKTGKIGYLGPLINDETRRLAPQPTSAPSIAGPNTWARILLTWLSRSPGLVSGSISRVSPRIPPRWRMILSPVVMM